MSTTTENPNDTTAEAVDPAAARDRSDAIAIFAITFAAISVLTAIFAVGLAVRAVQRVDDIEVGGGAGGGGASSTVSVSMVDYEFIPSDFTVAAGGTLEVTNDGTQPHDLVVEGLTTGALDAGTAATLSLGDLAAGTYDYFCSVPGHEGMGMTGTLTVS